MKKNFSKKVKETQSLMLKELKDRVKHNLNAQDGTKLKHIDFTLEDIESYKNLLDKKKHLTDSARRALNKQYPNNQDKVIDGMSKFFDDMPIITTKFGQLKYPGAVTKIPSNNITMKGVDYPVVGVSDLGDKKLMMPNEDYKFEGTEVTEYPMMKNKKRAGVTSRYQQGGKAKSVKDSLIVEPKINPRFIQSDVLPLDSVPPISPILRGNPRLKTSVPPEIIPIGKPRLKNSISPLLEYGGEAKSGIHIKKSHRGLLHKNLGVPAGKPIPASKLAIKSTDSPAVKKRKVFAQNAKKWHHSQDGGQYDKDGNFIPFSMGDIAPQGQVDITQDSTMPNASPFFNPLNTPDPNAGISYQNMGAEPPKEGGGLAGAIPIVGGIIKGIGLLKQEKKQKQSAHQFRNLSNVVKKAAETRPEQVKRKYVRPEDQILDPNTVFPTYGTGTNYLAKDGANLKEAQFGQLLGFAGQLAGNVLGGGNAFNQSGGTQIGGAIGSIFGPVGKGIGSLLGGALDQNARKIKRYNAQGQANLQQAGFQQGTQELQDQYTGFMKDGGYLAMGGELKTHWGGNAETISNNPFLPDGGETVMFRGKSHENGGIGMTYGKNSIEVEGGEPAVKLENGGTGEQNLTIFGDMKIPSYGVAEIGDKNARGKKFKNYINDLSKIEAKQDKVVNKGVSLVNSTNPSNSFDKLKMNSGELLMLGGNMKLKEIADKKQIAANVQNAILDTAEELGLESDKLAEGKIKKAKKGGKYAQDGSNVPSGEATIFSDPIKALKKLIGREDVDVKTFKKTELDNLLKEQYKPIQEIPDIYKKQGQQTIAPETFKAVGGGDNKPSPGWYKAIKSELNRGVTYEELAGKGHGTVKGLQQLFPNEYRPASTATPDQYARVIDDEIPTISSYNDPPEEVHPMDSGGGNNPPVGKNRFKWTDALNYALPLVRPTNQLPLDPNQLMGEMYALSANQLEPVQAQRYSPLLQQPYDISLQDQMNANQADFNTATRLSQNNPAANSTLAGQKYAANSGVLGEQFRQNQAMKANVYNQNRNTLNDAQLKNLGIMDQQYVRQAQAKSNTKAVAQQALNSIASKIQQNKLENKTLGIYENMYNYRYGNNGHAWNWNGLQQFNTDRFDTPQQIDNKGNVIQTYQTSDQYDKNRMFKGTTRTNRTTVKTKDGKRNGALVQAMKGSNLKSYC